MGDRIHSSSSCTVIEATDLADASKVVVKVVIKLIIDKQQFLREVNGRERDGLGEDSVVGIISSSRDPDLEPGRWKRDVAERGYHDYPYGIVMKAAQRNLMMILIQEKLRFWDIVVMFESLLRCLVFGPSKQQDPRGCQAT